jgi:hypothetical protein
MDDGGLCTWRWVKAALIVIGRKMLLPGCWVNGTARYAGGPTCGKWQSDLVHPRGPNASCQQNDVCALEAVLSGGGPPRDIGAVNRANRVARARTSDCSK